MLENFSGIIFVLTLIIIIYIGEKWRSHRKMIAPTFHINILKSFVNVFNQNSKNVVEKMRGEVGKVFDVHDYMSGVTVDILLGIKALLPNALSSEFHAWYSHSFNALWQYYCHCALKNVDIRKER